MIPKILYLQKKLIPLYVLVVVFTRIIKPSKIGSERPLKLIVKRQKFTTVARMDNLSKVFSQHDSYSYQNYWIFCENESVGFKNRGGDEILIKN